MHVLFIDTGQTYFSNLNQTNTTELFYFKNRRYIAIIHPHSYRNWVAPKACLVMITFSWAISVATMLPACFGVGGHFVASPGIGQCSLAPTSVVSYAFLGLSTYGPYVVVSLVLMRVVVRTITRRCTGLFSRSSQVCDVAGRKIPLPVVAQPLIIQRRFNVALMLLVSFLFCVACNLPTYITLSFYQSLYLKYPLLTVWLRLSLVSQYAFSSVRSETSSLRRKMIRGFGSFRTNFMERGFCACKKPSM